MFLCDLFLYRPQQHKPRRNKPTSHTWFGWFPSKRSWGSSKSLIQQVLFNSLKKKKKLNKTKEIQLTNGMAKPWELHTVRELTLLIPTAIADDVEGWGSAGGGPGEAGSMVLRVGLTVFLIHDAIVELWLFTESMRSPTRFQVKQTNKQTVGSRLFTVVVVSWLTYTALSQLIFLICNSVQNRNYPFVTSLSSSHPARGSVHLPNFKHTQAQFSKHAGVAFAYTPHKGIERMDSIIICVVKNTKARQNLTQYSVFSFKPLRLLLHDKQRRYRSYHSIGLFLLLWPSSDARFASVCSATGSPLRRLVKLVSIHS